MPRTVAEAIREADDLYEKDAYKEYYALLEDVIENEGLQDGQLDWRFARAINLLMKETEDPEEQKQSALRAHKYAAQAVEKLPDSSSAQKWAGITLGKKGKYLPTKEKINNAYVIRDHFQKAIDIDPKDSTAYHCFGVWHWEILQLSMMERGIASMLFGAPPKTTYEECEKCLMKCFELEPENIFNCKLLGDMHYQLKHWKDAKMWYERAASQCKVTTKETHDIRAEAVKLAAKCG